jgi:hypothetical protein
MYKLKLGRKDGLDDISHEESAIPISDIPNSIDQVHGRKAALKSLFRSLRPHKIITNEPVSKPPSDL